MCSAFFLRISTALSVALASWIAASSSANSSFVGAFLDGFSSLPASITILMSPDFSALFIVSTERPSEINSALALSYVPVLALFVNFANTFLASCVLFLASL